MISTANILALENNDMRYDPENEIYQTLESVKLDMGEMIEVLSRHIRDEAPRGLYSVDSLEPIATENSLIFYRQPLPKNAKILEVYHVPNYQDVVNLRPVDIYVYTGSGGIFEAARSELLANLTIRTKASPEKLIAPAKWLVAPANYLRVDRPLIPYLPSKLAPSIAKRLLAEVLDIPNFNYDPIEEDGPHLAYLDAVMGLVGKEGPSPIKEAVLNLRAAITTAVGRYVNHIHRTYYNPFTRKLVVERGIDHFAYLYHQQEMVREINAVGRETGASEQELIRDAIEAMDRARDA